MRLGWAGKVALSAAVPIIVALGAFGIFVQGRVRGVTRSQIERDLVDEATVLAHGLRPGDLEAPDLGARVARLGGAIRARITVVAGSGRVLADTEVKDVGAMENHGQRPEVVLARERGTGVVARFSHTVRRELIYAAAAVPDCDAIVRIARDVSGVKADLRRPTRNFWWFGAGVVVLAMIAAVVLTRGLTRPLLDLTEAARQVEAGDLGAHVYPRGRDELATLGHAFNRMTQQLQESLDTAHEETARLSTILEGMTEGVVAVDRDERISFLNGAAREILALDPVARIEGARFYELVRDPSILGMVQMAASRREPLQSEVRHEGPPRRMIQVYAAPVGDETPGVILVLRDMSRLRRLEKMRSDFVSNVSHELRTPLASIAAALETLEDDEARLDAETGPRFLAMIRRNLGRLEALLNDILALSRLESRPETLPKEPVDFAQVTRASAEEFQTRARKGGVALRVRAEGRQIVVGDVSTLRRVVDNLILNAITYTPEGGEIDVAVSAAGDAAILEVADTGIGIPRDEIDRIFERFYRVDKARSRSVGGTGLGLAIVKHAVGLHGGTVEVESELARGTRFTVRIPLAPVEAAARAGKTNGETTA